MTEHLAKYKFFFAITFFRSKFLWQTCLKILHLIVHGPVAERGKEHFHDSWSLLFFSREI